MTIDDNSIIEDNSDIMACCKNKVYNGFCEEHGFLRAGRTLDSSHPYFLPSTHSQQERTRANIPTRKVKNSLEYTLNLDESLLAQYFKYFNKN